MSVTSALCIITKGTSREIDLCISFFHKCLCYILLGMYLAALFYFNKKLCDVNTTAYLFFEENNAYSWLTVM